MTVKNLMHDLFTNNIDFTAKQFQLLVDFLYGEENNNSQAPTATPFYLSETYILRGFLSMSDTAPSSYRGYSDYYLVNMRIDGAGLNMSSIDYDPNAFTGQYAQGATYSAEVFKNLNFNVPFSESVVDARDIKYDGDQVYIGNYQSPFNSRIQIGMLDFGFTNIDNILPNGRATISNYPPMVNHVTSQSVMPILPHGNRSTLEYVRTNYGSQIVVSPSMTSGDVNNIINTYNIDGPEWNIITESNYNGDTIYNYYNSSTGDIIINGGSYTNNNGVLVTGNNFAMPLTYVNLESIFDKLIDDINIDFGFDGSDGLEPLDFPSYNEIKYEDMGSFYITPIKQIDKLPLAPDIADTVIDVSDYVDLLGGASTALFNALDGFGLSLMAAFTFLSVLVIRHLKR